MSFHFTAFVADTKMLHDTAIRHAPDAPGEDHRSPRFGASTADVNGCKLALKRGGRGEPLLFLHGTDGLVEWPALLDRLAERRDVVAPDHPGFGDTPLPGWIDDISDMAYFYLDAIEVLDLSGIHLVGHSLGGWIALEMAVRCCHRLRSLTLIDSAGIHVKGVPKTDIFLIDPDEQARMMYADPELGERAAERALAEKHLDLTIRNRTTSARLGWKPRFFNPHLGRWLHRVKVPTHIIWGAQDRIIPAVYAKTFHSLIPQSVLTIVPGASHLPHVEREDTVLSAMQQFLQPLQEGSSAMRVMSFHLMPYADLDLSVRDKYRSVWVVLPNSYFDPEKGHALYNRYLDELELCAELGFDGVCVNEHHQNAYGLMPSPVVMAAALSRRTRDCRIAILGNAFCLREHPLTLAEEHAMIDGITGGRLISGFVRGIGAEYYSIGVNPVHSLERHQEAHDLVVRAWTEPGPFAFEGKFYHFEYVNVWPRPYQQPHPPIWCPSMGSLETIEWAAHPDRKYVYLQNYSAIDFGGALSQPLSRDCAAPIWLRRALRQIGWGAPIYVAETDEQAMQRSAAAYRGAVQRLHPESIGADVLAAGLHVARIAEARHDQQARQSRRRRDDREPDRARHRHSAAARTRCGDAFARHTTRPGSRSSLRCCSSARCRRTDGKEHPALRQRGDAGAERLVRQGISRLRTDPRGRRMTAAPGKGANNFAGLIGRSGDALRQSDRDRRIVSANIVGKGAHQSARWEDHACRGSDKRPQNPPRPRAVIDARANSRDRLELPCG